MNLGPLLFGYIQDSKTYSAFDEEHIVDWDTTHSPFCVWHLRYLLDETESRDHLFRAFHFTRDRFIHKLVNIDASGTSTILNPRGHKRTETSPWTSLVRVSSTKCVKTCVTKCVYLVPNGARFVRLPLLVSLARFLIG